MYKRTIYEFEVQFIFMRGENANYPPSFLNSQQENHQETKEKLRHLQK